MVASSSAGVLQLDDAQRQAVDEQHDIRAAGIPALGDGELVDRQPVVGGGVVEVDDMHLRPANASLAVTMLHSHAADEHPVEGSVAGLKARPFRSGELAIGVVQRIYRQAGIQLGKGVAEPSLQHKLPVVVSLGIGRLGCDVRAVGHLPAEARQPIKRGLFDFCFGDGGHFVQSTTPTIARITMTVRTT